MQSPFTTPFLAAALLAPVLLAPSAGAQMTTTLVASGLSRPLYLTSPPGDSRLFVVEQFSGTTGRIRVIENGVLLATPFLSISPVANGNEQGLLGVAFHPDYANNGLFYINYTDNAGDTRVVRYQASPPTSNTANPASATQLLFIDQPFSNHNGGWMGFGPDGYLYISTGDGGSANDPGGRAQDITSMLLGKLLRIDVDGGAPYAIPPSNPFVGVTGDDEIWAYGLRNPWRCSFDRLTGDLYIGDVGQGAVEEIDFQPAASVGGENYGWRCMEGNSCTGLTGCTCMDVALTDPIQTYTHGSGCSVTGGYVYRGSALPFLQGTYFYADYCSSTIWSFQYVGGSVTNFQNRTSQLDPPGVDTITSITSFGEDANGEMYIIEQGGQIWRIDPTPGGFPNCPGDGTLATPCPCGNFGGAGRGCMHSGMVGALLTASGATNPDTIVFTGSSMPAIVSGIYLKGDAYDPSGIVFGDGLRCADGNLIRLRTKQNVNGTSMYPEVGDPLVSVRGQTPPGSGLTGYYTLYYRNAAALWCPPLTFNSTNGWQITW